jgi:hypothetical protein
MLMGVEWAVLACGDVRDLDAAAFVRPRPSGRP